MNRRMGGREDHLFNSLPPVLHLLKTHPLLRDVE
jgi:hypothetical protein